MDTVSLITQLHRDSVRIGELLQRLDLAAAVPTCPGWDVRDLILHLGCTQRWAADIVAEARTHQHWMDEENYELPSDPELAAWFAHGAEQLVDLLADRPPEIDCWVFMAGVESPLHFWARRQSHEAAIHRVDAEAAALDSGVDQLTGFDPETAADGLDEIITGFWTRPNRGPRAEPATSVGFVPDDHPGRWTAYFDSTACQATRSVNEDTVQATVHGSVADLFAWAWDRPTLASITVAGDGEAVRRMKPDDG